MEQAQGLYAEVESWFKDNGADGVCMEDIFVSDKPRGKKQNKEGEYCDQVVAGSGEDSFYGSYYHQVEGENYYVGYKYWC